MDDSNEPEDNGSGYKHKVEDIHEYETQFFGFTPKSFMDGVYNAVSDFVSDCFGELETELMRE
ncbi:hypothetical protein QZH41_012796, partial [Actinostola sp. cb2023]